MTVEQQTGVPGRPPAPRPTKLQAHRWTAGRNTLRPRLTSLPVSPAAAAGPATDFNNVGVQEMMKLYYCERLQPGRLPPIAA